MNDPATSSAPKVFRPLTLLAGVGLGLVLLGWAGRAVNGHNWHPGFERFHPLIAPESRYQPTIGEMQAIVRAQCRPDQILVIVGGNSIFQGVGQPVDKLWSHRLQAALGARYAVINLAFRGSSPSDGGALVAESLRAEFPHQVYLANTLPFTPAAPAGSLDYQFMLFDAASKDLLLDLPARRAEIKDRLTHPAIYPTVREIHLGSLLDAPLRFRDFWNWWSATRGFTFPTTLTTTAAEAFRARNRYQDREPDFEDIPLKQRFQPQFSAAEMAIIRNMSSPYYRLDASGRWQRDDVSAARFQQQIAVAFPPPLKARTLIVLSENCPYYIRQLSPDEQARNELAYRDSVAEWQAGGYPATDYGAGFTDLDFGDRTHLSASGGAKLATRLAPQIRALAHHLGYPNP